MYFNTANNVIRFFNGTVWADLGGTAVQTLNVIDPAVTYPGAGTSLYKDGTPGTVTHPYRINDGVTAGVANAASTTAVWTTGGAYDNTGYTRQTPYSGQGGGTINGPTIEYAIPASFIGGYDIYFRPDINSRDFNRWAVLFSPDGGNTWEAPTPGCLRNATNQNIPGVIDISTARRFREAFGSNTLTQYNRIRLVIVQHAGSVENQIASVAELDALQYA
jgi:hypothetical protein